MAWLDFDFMSLSVNLRHLELREVRLKGKLPVSELDLDIQDEMIRLEKPLEYDLEIQRVEHALLVQGRLQLILQCQCVRCLKPFEYDLDLKNWTIHLPLQGEERVEVVNDCVDLTPYVREDILLEFPQHPLCRLDCGGLPKADLARAKKGGIAGQSGKSSAWAELDRLKLKRF
jgi:uncharacterized protein